MKDDKLIRGIEFGNMKGEENKSESINYDFNQSQPIFQQQVSEEDILNNPNIRNDMLSKVYVLSQIGKLLLLPDQEYTTIELASQYFMVPYETIKKLIQRNYNELQYNGLLYISGENLKQYKNKVGGLLSHSSESVDTYINKYSPTLTLLNKRVILNIAMLLRDSEVAKEIRHMILDSLETPQGMMAFLTTIYYKVCEIDNNVNQYINSQTKDPIDKPIKNSVRDRTLPDVPEYLQEVFKQTK